MTAPEAAPAPTAGRVPTPGTTDPGVFGRLRSALDATGRRRVLGWVLLVAWAVWLAALWVAQPRLVPQEFLADQLAQGQVTGYRLVTVDEDGGRGVFSGPPRLDVVPVSDEDPAESLDGTYEGSPVSVAYWVDAPVAQLRVVDPNGLSSEVPAALVHELTAAGVPTAAPSRLWFHPSQRIHNAGALLLFLTFLVVVLGPRPRRGTRWFWFWLLGGPASVGIAIFAVAELLRPRYEPEGTMHPPGVAGRWSGLTGFAAGLLLAFAGSAVLLALTGISPIWFLRG
jgi:hypothetical protein